jgi:DedD protein
MRSAFQEEDEDELAPRQHADRELTLSSTTLLVIFFGLVLVCGLFFGFGYTLGRRAPSETQDVVAAAEPAPLPVSSGQPKPSAASAGPAPVDSAQDTADATTETPAENASPAPAAAAPTVQAVSEPVRTGVAATGIQPALSVSQTRQTSQTSQPTVKPALATTSPAVAPAAAGTIMVQIAAVSNAADADVLLGALRKRGYSVGVRNQPGDALLHVQVGPFASRAEAVAMRQKLLGDGYNAILK